MDDGGGPGGGGAPAERAGIEGRFFPAPGPITKMPLRMRDFHGKGLERVAIVYPGTQRFAVAERVEAARPLQ